MPDELVGTKRSKGRYMLAACSSYLGSLSIGMALGYSSPAAADIKEKFPDIDISFVGSILTIGALIGGLLSGVLCEWRGRKGTILLTTLIFTSGWVLIFLGTFQWRLIFAGRFLLGLGCGIICMVIPVYIGEVSTPERRGILGTGHQFNMVFGILIAYTLGVWLHWIPLAVACFVPVVLTAVVFLFMPESPTFLSKSNATQQAVMESLYFLHGRTLAAEAQYELLKDAKMSEKNTDFTISDIASPSVLKPLGLSIGLMFFQQLSGINAVIFYTEDIFKSAGTDMDPKLEAIIVGVVQVVFTVPAALLMDRAGRRILLHISGAVELVGLLALVLFYWLKETNPDAATHISWLPTTALSLFVAGFSVGYGPVAWLMMGELLPARARGAGTAVCTSFNWFCAFLVTMFFHNIRDGLGDAVSYGIFAGIVLIGIVFVAVAVPETKGKTLDEIEDMFSCNLSSGEFMNTLDTVDGGNH